MAFAGILNNEVVRYSRPAFPRPPQWSPCLNKRVSRRPRCSLDCHPAGWASWCETLRNVSGSGS